MGDFVSQAVDVDNLETSATLSKYGKKTVGLSSPKPQSPEQAAEMSKAKKKKKRKKKLPKNYNPNVDPDPYRWVAIKEREKLKNSLGLKATLLARLKPMIGVPKLMQARVPPPKAPRLVHPHRLDPENQN